MLVILYNYLVLATDATILGSVAIPALLTPEVYIFLQSLAKLLAFAGIVDLLSRKGE